MFGRQAWRERRHLKRPSVFFLADFGGVTLAPLTLVISWRFGIVLCVMLTSNLLEFLNCSCCVIS